MGCKTYNIREFFSGYIGNISSKFPVSWRLNPIIIILVVLFEFIQIILTFFCWAFTILVFWFFWTFFLYVKIFIWFVSAQPFNFNFNDIFLDLGFCWWIWWTGWNCLWWSSYIHYFIVFFHFFRIIIIQYYN